VTFELIDLQLLGAKAVEDFHASLRKGQENDRVNIRAAVNQLVGKLEFAYGVAARLAHREPTLEGTHAIWSKMVALCDELGGQLRTLGTDDPVCRASYDRLLDFRNAAERRRGLHA